MEVLDLNELIDSIPEDQDLMKFKEIIKLYPDILIVKVDPEGAMYLPSSTAVNSQVDDVTILDEKSPDFDGEFISVRPYKNVDGILVYSNPPEIIIGSMNREGFGVVPLEELEDVLDELQLNYKARKLIAEYLASRVAIYI